MSTRGLTGVVALAGGNRVAHIDNGGMLSTIVDSSIRPRDCYGRGNLVVGGSLDIIRTIVSGTVTRGPGSIRSCGTNGAGTVRTVFNTIVHRLGNTTTPRIMDGVLGRGLSGWDLSIGVV